MVFQIRRYSRPAGPFLDFFLSHLSSVLGEESITYRKAGRRPKRAPKVKIDIANTPAAMLFRPTIPIEHMRIREVKSSVPTPLHTQVRYALLYELVRPIYLISDIQFKG